MPAGRHRVADRGAAREYIASSMCFSGLLFALIYGIQGRWIDVAVLLLVGLGQVVAFLCFRHGHARAVTSLIMLVAGVSAAEQVYSSIWWWDLLIHFSCTYVLVWIAWNYALRRSPELGRLSRGQRLMMCAITGLVLAVVWEVMELLGFLLVTPDIHIPPLDTLSDVTVGVLGAALVALHRKSR